MVPWQMRSHNTRTGKDNTNLRFPTLPDSTVTSKDVTIIVEIIQLLFLLQIMDLDDIDGSLKKAYEKQFGKKKTTSSTGIGIPPSNVPQSLPVVEEPELL